MGKKRVGIISFYYKNYNYGGMLQAYALCKFIETNNFFVEQITFDNSIRKDGNIMLEPLSERFIRASISEKLKMLNNFIKSKMKIQIENFYNHKIEDIVEKRKIAFDTFSENFIPHSTKVYNESDIQECVEMYDVFITGSDQVWNPIYYNSQYFLDFVKGNKIKMSYAASLSQKTLNLTQRRVIENHLKDFDAISLREKDSIELISEITNKDVTWTLDPTMLLSSDQWNEICSERLIREEYIFCYFLGEDKKSQKTINDFANNKHLKIVMIPYLHGKYQKSDETFGDIKLQDISPQEFLSLIKYATYIFTDSYHSAVFSCLYAKEFYVFPRAKNRGMDTRISSLAKLFEFEDHFISSPELNNLSYIDNLPTLNYQKNFKLFNELRDDSIKYLLTHIDGGMAEKTIF